MGKETLGLRKNSSYRDSSGPFSDAKDSGPKFRDETRYLFQEHKRKVSETGRFRSESPKGRRK